MSNLNEPDVCSALMGFLEDSILDESVQITNECDLDQLGIDSFSLIEIILFIERKFGVRIPDSELTKENLRSLSSITQTVIRINGGG